MNYVCTVCKEEKDSSAFYADKRNRFKGVSSKCKICARLWQAEYKKKIGYTQADRKRGQRWRDNNLVHARQQERVKRANNRASYRAAVMRYKTARLNRVPAWAEAEKIKKVYEKAHEFGFEVDHIVPLQHPLVSGLHVWNNLQLLDLKLNRSKSNKEWPDMPTALSDAALQAMTT